MKKIVLVLLCALITGSTINAMQGNKNGSQPSANINLQNSNTTNNNQVSVTESAQSPVQPRYLKDLQVAFARKNEEIGGVLKVLREGNEQERQNKLQHAQKLIAETNRINEELTKTLAAFQEMEKSNK